MRSYRNSNGNDIIWHKPSYNGLYADVYHRRRNEIIGQLN